MNYWDKKLMRSQLDNKLLKLKPLHRLKPPKKGWINHIRVSLGMTLNELGMRVGLDKSRLSRIEKAEPTGEIKISTLEKVAEGMGMRFVYGFFSEKELEEIVRAQARKIALERLSRIDHSMKLEDQEVNQEIKNQALEGMIEKILIEDPTGFWEK